LKGLSRLSGQGISKSQKISNPPRQFFGGEKFFSAAAAVRKPRKELMRPVGRVGLVAKIGTPLKTQRPFRYGQK
jgi:hypothetical protein